MARASEVLGLTSFGVGRAIARLEAANPSRGMRSRRPEKITPCKGGCLPQLSRLAVDVCALQRAALTRLNTTAVLAYAAVYLDPGSTLTESPN
jgi:hypothetical protein